MLQLSTMAQQFLLWEDKKRKLLQCPELYVILFNICKEVVGKIKRATFKNAFSFILFKCEKLLYNSFIF